MGEVRDIAAVIVNGEPAGVAWKHPYVVDITRAIRRGQNHLEIRVTNRLINARLERDPSLPPPYYHVRDYVAAPETAGLRGPVLLRVTVPGAPPAR